MYLANSILKASDYLPWLGYDETTGLFWLDDRYIGFAFAAEPMSGYDENMEQRFKTLLTYEFPPGTFLQFNLLVFDDVANHMLAIGKARSSTDHPLIRSATESTIAFLREGARGQGVDFPIRNATMIISCKLPIRAVAPTDQEIEAAERTRREVRETCSEIGFHDLRPVSDAELLYQLGVVLNRHPKASWREGRFKPDPTVLLRDQVLDLDTTVEVTKSHLVLNDTYVTSLSAKKYPQHSYFGLARYFSVEPVAGLRGIPCAHMITGTVLIQDVADAKITNERKRQIYTYYANGPLGRLMPEYGRRAADLTAMNGFLSNGQFIHKISLSVTLFNRSAEEAQRNTARTRTYLSEIGITAMPDEYVLFPMLRANLPLGPERADVRDLSRFKTMNTDALATMLPVFFEWRGTRTPLITLVGRAGQLMGWSPWDSTTNYNFSISAESGGGKSFLSNEIISAVLGASGKVWVIDVGRSYVKLCESLEGQFIAFDPDNTICLNPFSSLKTDREFEEVQDILLHLLAVMAAPQQGLSDFQLAELRTVLREQHKIHGASLSIDHIAEACMVRAGEQKDAISVEKRLSDVARGLTAFCSTGQYGRYFNGPANIDFSAQFVLLELEELKAQRHLQTIVLLLLIYQIQQGMYLGDRSVKKLMLIDETWDLLSEPQIAKFIEAGYRRFRKYNGSAGIITQTLTDLHDSATGAAILANSSATLMLQQKDTTLNKLAAGPQAEFTETLCNVLKTVHTVPGKYSEVYIKTGLGAGIGRLMVDPFRRLLYSTDPKDVADIDWHKAQGKSTTEAISAVLTARGRSIGGA